MGEFFFFAALDADTERGEDVEIIFLISFTPEKKPSSGYNFLSLSTIASAYLFTPFTPTQQPQDALQHM